MRLLSKPLRIQWCQLSRPSWLAQPPLTRLVHTTSRLAAIKPFILSDIGEGIKEVQIIQWFVEPGARVREFDKICEVVSDKATVEITSRYDGVVKKLHHEPEDMAQVGKPLCDIDDLGEIPPEDEAVLESTSEQAGGPSTSQQPQKAAEEHQSKLEQNRQTRDTPKAPTGSKHSSLATPAVRGLLKELEIDISEVVGTGKDGRVLKEDVLNHASSRSTPSSSPSPSSTDSSTTVQDETPITLTPVQSHMFKAMTRSLSIPHFLYADEIDITALSRLRSHINYSSAPQNQPKLSYLPFIIKSLSLSLHHYPILNARISTAPLRVNLRSSHNIGIAMDTPQGLLVPNIKHVETLSVLDIAHEISRLRSLALGGKLASSDLTGGTITVSNIGSIGGTYVSPIIASDNEVAILGVGKKRVVPTFSGGDDGQGEERVVRKEVMCFSWSADHRVVDGATMAKCAEVVRRLVERPEGMIVRLR